MVPTWHIELSSPGYKKRDHENCDLADAYKLLKWSTMKFCHWRPLLAIKPQLDNPQPERVSNNAD